MEVPETSEKPTQLFRIHNIIQRRTQLFAVFYKIFSGRSGGLPGALDLNNIRYIIHRYLYNIIYNIIYNITTPNIMNRNDCDGFSDVSGSSTSTSTWTATWRTKGLLPFVDSRTGRSSAWGPLSPGGLRVSGGPHRKQSLSPSCRGSIWTSGRQTQRHRLTWF